MWEDYLRLIRLARTPTPQEYFRVVKVAGAGILLIGLLGFMIYLIAKQLSGIF